MPSRISPHWMLALAVIGMIFLASPGRINGGPTTATSAPADDETRADFEKQLDRHVPELHFNNNKLVDVIDFLRDVTGVNLYVDWKNLAAVGVKQDSPVAYTAQDLAFKQCLDEIMKGLKPTKPVGFQSMGNTIVISTVQGLEAMKKVRDTSLQKADDTNLQAQLDKHLPELRFNANSLGDVVDFIRDVSGANIYVSWSSLQKAGIDRDAPVTLRLADVSLRDALDILLHDVSTQKAAAGFHAMDNVIVISTDDGIQALKTAREAEPLKIEDAKLRDQLRRHLPEVRFNANALGDVVDFLHDVTGAKISVNWASLKESEITKDSPITLRLRDVSLRDALDLIFNEASTRNGAGVFSADGEVITLTTGSAKKTPR